MPPTERWKAKGPWRKFSAGGRARFYFEEGIISQEQSVNRPLAHLLLDNLQKFDETLGVAKIAPMHER
jgi:hypothetical protein